MQMLEKREEKLKYSWRIIRYNTTLIFKTKNEMKTSKQQFIHQRKNVTMRKIKPRVKQRVFKNEEIPIRKIKKDFTKFNLQPKAKKPLSAT